MFLVTWLFDKIGYMPKSSVRITFPFPVVEKNKTLQDLDLPVRKAVKKAIKKTVKIPKATTRKPKTK